MTKGQFAHQHGYTTFEEMVELSTAVCSLYGELWLITRVEKQFLAWVDKHYDQPLGHFQTYEEAESCLVSLCKELCVLSQRLVDI
ncbi:MAG: hypothetical protein Q8912_11135 [Bacillota bacterium]|nr:hypothetical protein [Bacillota bacterium]